MVGSVVQSCQAPGLGAWDRIGCYCERGLDPSFWAEPLNALSNLGFIAAAVFAWLYFRNHRPLRGAGVIACFIGLLAVIGAGSFLFHTYATVWARIADVAPIGLFILAYVGLALRWFVGLALPLALALAVLVTITTFAMPPWFNGSAFYAPALLMLVVLAATLSAKRHGAGRWLMAATGVFVVSLALRSIDRLEFACAANGIGSHWAWHLLNAVVLYLLLRAAIHNPPAPKQKRA